MDVNGAAAPVVAVVGVVGTLLSALLTQRAAERSRRREQERAERARARALEAEQLRTCYVALNTASRQYLAALTDQLHALLRTEDPRAARQRLTEARDLHRDVYAEAQMRLPDPVLALAGEVTHALGTLYGRLRRLDDGVPRPGDSLEAAQGQIDALWERLRELRRGMRADLGASGVSGVSGMYRLGPSETGPHRPGTHPGASGASSGC
ncbi:hypothetical protein [Streptomyces roseochromogenus]|uniref:Uncharacterized protein n=1 Tax=Streptomyces roseochromogenus subsp. oscitans DS 12.976 TaxID=1352936 RepID=V6JUX3_STRRC|nr:hypothetical protein [Streptomyces roseochromogenus]EST20669.1 hypothetical protein M878_39250 [Streptomyces roseochromogenus subsp. oscitans DS 12.976]